VGAEDDAEEASTTKARNLARVRLLMFLTFVLVVAFVAVLIFGMASTVRWEEEWLVGGSTVDQEEFKPIDIRVLPWPYLAALDETNRQLEEMELGNISTIDPDSNEFKARLILDYKAGSVMYWRFEDDEVEVDFDAYSGEIIHYLRLLPQIPGNLSSEEALGIAEGIAEQFAPIPDDVLDIFELRDSYPVEEGYGDTTASSSDAWYILFNRGYDEEIRTTDEIRLIIAMDGTLHKYDKHWWMDLKDLDTEFTVSQAEATMTAMVEFGEGFVPGNITERVVRPNNFFEGTTYYSTPPLDVWEVQMYTTDGRLAARVHIHPRQADTIVGGQEFPYYEE